MEIQRYGASKAAIAIEIRNGITFDFYMKLPHMIPIATIFCEVKDYGPERQMKQWLSNQITYSMSGMVMW